MNAKPNPEFSAVALDHGNHPRNHGPLEDHTGHAVITGACGDTMEFWVMVAGGIVERVSFASDGCRSSRACGSMATCLAEGRNLSEAMALDPTDILAALEKIPEKAVHCSQLAALTLGAACRDHIARRRQATEPTNDASSDKEITTMKIAIPLAGETLAMHFGHCERFALMDVDPADNRIVKREDVPAPPHEPGLLPRWLAEQGAEVIVAGGMGQRAHALFAERGIRVVVGAPSEKPEKIVTDYLAGTLKVGDNLCDH